MRHFDALSRNWPMAIENEFICWIRKAQHDDENLTLIINLLKHTIYEIYFGS